MLTEGKAEFSTDFLSPSAVFKGAYESGPNIQTVEILNVMKRRADAAGTLASKNVKYCAETPAELRSLGVHARLDLYIFDHISNNLLSNARKVWHAHGKKVRMQLIRSSPATGA